jgi:hypothetical protein
VLGAPASIIGSELSVYLAPAFILSLAALFLLLFHIAFGAAFALPGCTLRGTSGRATMTILGGAGTYTYPLSERSFLRARHHRLLS